MAVEQPQGVAGHDHQGLLVRHDLQIFLDEPVLHPVLTHLPRLAVGHQLIGVQGHVEVQVVVHHHLEGLGLYAVAPILVDGLAVQFPLRPEAIAVDPAVLLQLPGKLPGHLQMVVRVDIPQGVADGQGLVRTDAPPAWGPGGSPPGRRGPSAVHSPASPSSRCPHHKMPYAASCLVLRLFQFNIIFDCRKSVNSSKKRMVLPTPFVLFYNAPPKVSSGSPSRPNPEPPAPAALLHCRDDPALSRIKFFRNHLLPSCNRIVLAFPPTVFYNIKQNRFRGTFS